MIDKGNTSRTGTFIYPKCAMTLISHDIAAPYGHRIHGSLLAAGEFIENTGDYAATTSYFEAVRAIGVKGRWIDG